MLDRLARERLAPLWLHVLVILAWLAVFLPANVWFGPNQIWLPLREASHGLVYPALLVGLACMLLVVGMVLFAIGRFRPRELGLELGKLPDAIVYTLLVWTLMQLVAIALSRFAGESPQLVFGLNGNGAGHLAGALVAQLFGNALCEEVLFRGFLFVELGILFCRWLPDQPRLGLVAAGLVSSVVFAIAHLPHRHWINGGYADWSALAMDQGWLVVWGCVYCWLYVRTENLLFVVGVHALANARTMLVTAPAVAEFLPLSQMLGVGIALVWHRLPGHAGHTVSNFLTNSPERSMGVKVQKVGPACEQPIPEDFI
jgi:membrane protease YdiL (CAAX protease family)